MLANVTTNNNTGDGGFLRSRNGVTTGLQIITVDQATGIMTNDNPTVDLAAAQAAFSIEYIQNDSTIVTRSHTLEADPV